METSFAASEGAEEGASIKALANGLILTTPAEDLRIFVARDGAELVGAILFTRLHFEGDERWVMLLSPVAVAPDRQRTGIGQALLRHGLEVLCAEGVDVAVTYGDPAYYGKVGFGAVDEKELPAPQPLSYPHGWIAQSLSDAALAPFCGPSRCAPALNDPAFW